MADKSLLFQKKVLQLQSQLKEQTIMKVDPDVTENSKQSKKSFAQAVNQAEKVY